MEPKIIDLYDEYTDGGLTRREFLEKLSLLVGGTAAALALLPKAHGPEGANNHAGTAADTHIVIHRYKAHFIIS